MGSVEEVFTRSAVMELAGPAVYGRGVGYFREGRVEPEASSDGWLRATVRGSMPYTVELSDADGQPDWACTCPYAEDGAFCKHAVAVTLRFHEGELGALDGDPADLVGEPPADHEALLTEHVAGLGHERLVELVLEAADEDWRLRERLRAEARAARGDGPALAAWRRRIEVAFAPYGDFVPYQEAAGWAREVDEVIDALVDLCDAGHPDTVAVLAEHAHRCADTAIGYVDDSDGWLTDISERLAELHLRACVEGEPDPGELARRLVGLELTSELDGFHRAAVTHAAVLGPEGLAEYRRQLQPRWGEVGPQTDGWSPQRYRVREAMAGVALAAADADALIEIYEDDLKSPDRYLEIARTLSGVGRVDEAERWAREGLDAFADRPWQTPPLREYLARLLRDRGEPSGALQLFWDAFERAPSLTAYRQLLEEAGDEAAAAKARSLDRLTHGLATRPDEGPARTASARSQVLVEILAYEGDTERAWQVAAEHGCDQQMWLTLARSREETHPLDAIEVYQAEVFAQIEVKKNGAYRQAVDLLARIRRLAREADEPERFTGLLEGVRAEHSRKRNLMQLIDRKGW